MSGIGLGHIPDRRACASPISAEELVNKYFDSRAGASVTLDIGRPEERHAEQRRAQMTVQRAKLAGVAIACFAFLAAAPGAALAQSKCTGKEIGAAGKKAGGKAKCWSKATKKGLAVDSACLSGAETKFSASYMNAQSKMDCVNGTAEGTIETKVDNFITDLVTEINGGTGMPTLSKCSSKEFAAAGKKAGGLLKCYAKAAGKGAPLDSACTGGAMTKFGTSWGKATTAADCNTTVSQGAIETKIDNFAADVNSELTAAGATTTTITGSTTTSTIGGTCAPIVIGQPIAGTYVLNGTTGEKRCTTNSAANRFGLCSSDTDCGATSGACLQLPWVTADGQVMPFPTGVQTVFTVGAAGSFPTCEHGVCVPCGNPNASCAGIPGCEVARNPNGCIPRGTQ